MFRIPFLALVLMVLVAPMTAQLMPGDYVAPVPSSTGSTLLGITPGGTVKTILTLPFPVAALTMAVNNRDLAVVGFTPTRSGLLATVTPNGTVSTVAQYTSYIYENLAVDSNGTYVVPVGQGGVLVMRVTPAGVMTTITPQPSVGKGKPRGIAVDISTGGYLVGEIPNLFLIQRDGSNRTVHQNVAINNSIDMLSDARTGHAIISQQNSLVQVDLTTGSMTSIQAGFNGCFPGLAYDRARDAWVMAGSCTFTNNNLYRVARGGATTTVTALSGASDLEVYGSLNVVANGDPTPGATLNLRFSEPGSPGDFYLAAASFSSGPGIPTPAGIIDLTPDALFAMSQLVPALFVNFQGALDANGTAPAAILIPPVPQLKGLRFYVSFVTIRNAAIRAIANTQGFSIQ
jgi:hypothetical protein